MDYNEVIENLKYLISEDCTDTQFDYEDEIEIAIRVMEYQEDLHSKIDKAIEEIEKLSIYWPNTPLIDRQSVLDILKNIGE